MLTLNRNYEIITSEANDKTWMRESSTDREGLIEIRTRFINPRPNFWQFL